MNEIVANIDGSTVTSGIEEQTQMEQRMLRNMCLTTVVSVLLSLPFASWRTTTGLLLGGGLALFNYRWLHTSVVAALSPNGTNRSSVFRIGRYVLRYAIVALVIASSYLLNVVSLTATLVGLCSFAVAGLIEAFLQIYFVIRRGT